MHFFRKKEYKVWIILSLIVMIAWGLTVRAFYNNYQTKQTNYFNTELQRFEGEVESTLITYEEFSNYIFDRLNQDEEILSIMAQANQATTEDKETLRNQLYDKVSKHYPIMQKYKFRQFHFHLPTTESFLRVHLPERYGDLLIDSRESVRLVNETETKISGFEEGKIFNGFRNVYPLEYQNKHVGSVEISMSSASIIETLSQLHERRDFYFVIDKFVVEDNLFEDQLENYRRSHIHEDYYVDIDVDEVTLSNHSVQLSSEEMFFKSIKEKNTDRFNKKESFSDVHTFEGKDYVVNFLGIKNFKNYPSAYLISVSECTGGYSDFIKDMQDEVLLVTILAMIVIAFGLALTIYQSKLKENAERDYLTNVYNRNKFYELTNREIRMAKRYNQETAILFMDIDHFKIINDTYGHTWGDKVLKELANEITDRIREVDVFARWGGEEFVLLLPHTGKDGALIVAEKIRKSVDESDSKELIDVTVSIGVAMLDSENHDITDAIGLADAAMYEAKRNGRNQVFISED